MGGRRLHSPVAQRQSTPLITGRPRIVTVREDQLVGTWDPARSSLSWSGNGLLIRPLRGSTPPGFTKFHRMKGWQNGDAPDCNSGQRRFDSGLLLQLPRIAELQVRHD